MLKLVQHDKENKDMKLGFVGLGKMGLRMVEKLLKEGHEVVVWNRSSAVAEEFKLKIKNEKLKIAKTIQDLVQNLKKPRVIWIMLPAGSVTRSILDEISQFVASGDIIIDGGNANYIDTEQRFNKLKTKNIKFLGIGVSGGIIAAENGYPLMVGGDKSAYEYVKPILDSLAGFHGGHEYFGTGGAGHFVKMVHNGIEYGYMQSLGEGFGILQKSAYNFNLEKVAKIYKNGTLLSGFMMDRVIEVLEKDASLSDIVGVIGKASGETVWAVAEAKKIGVPVEIIEKSLEFRNRSETDSFVQNSFAAKLVSALRNAFGGHEVKKRPQV